MSRRKDIRQGPLPLSLRGITFLTSLTRSGQIRQTNLALRFSLIPPGAAGNSRAFPRTNLSKIQGVFLRNTGFPVFISNVFLINWILKGGKETDTENRK